MLRRQKRPQPNQTNPPQPHTPNHLTTTAANLARPLLLLPRSASPSSTNTQAARATLATGIWTATRFGPPAGTQQLSDTFAPRPTASQNDRVRAGCGRRGRGRGRGRVERRPRLRAQRARLRSDGVPARGVAARGGGDGFGVRERRRARDGEPVEHRYLWEVLSRRIGHLAGGTRGERLGGVQGLGSEGV